MSEEVEIITEPVETRKKVEKSILCLFGCISILPGCRNALIRRMTFYPPQPAGYSFGKDTSLILHSESSEFPANVIFDSSCSIKVHTRILKKIYNLAVVLFYDSEYDIKKRVTIIFSHGNSTDIGYMTPQIYLLSKILDVNVIIYDYSAYGLSTGKISEKNTYRNIRDVYRYTVDELQIPPSQIIIYGQSVGSGPSIDIAADKRYPVGGLVIHSGIASGLRTLGTIKKSKWFDLYQNVEKLPRVKVPCLIIHGKLDKEVPFDQGLMLYEAVTGTSRKYYWWAKKGEHNGIEVRLRKQYYACLSSFLEIFSEKDEQESETPEEQSVFEKKMNTRKADISSGEISRMYMRLSTTFPDRD
eukprot:GHVL01032032.1.p1 GENE.GHVL01032032.1~~GHVL01032032.1.p1  ORF type:complete len:357 (+),score=46.38 GHVL01032032.1:172-1242(+)